MVLKRMKDALRAGDSVRAIIRGSAVNQDGKTLGMTLPNPEMQQSLIRSLYSRLAIDTKHVGYVEAPGTGTEAGDNAELGSLKDVLCADRKMDAPLLVGSIKSNIGHLEASSGLAGLIKAVLVLENKRIPPNLHIQAFKKGLKMDDGKLKVSLLHLRVVYADEKADILRDRTLARSRVQMRAVCLCQ